jgi:predicted nucleic acid-binding protein
MAFMVIDTSAVLGVLLEEPSRAALIKATKGYGLVGAPSLPWEVGNALMAGVRRRRLSAEAVRQAWASYQVVPVRLAEIDVGRALEIAMGLGLYAYDAYVLETARAERLPVLTLDSGLTRAAQQLGLRLVEFEQ